MSRVVTMFYADWCCGCCGKKLISDGRSIWCETGCVEFPFPCGESEIEKLIKTGTMTEELRLEGDTGGI